MGSQRGEKDRCLRDELVRRATFMLLGMLTLAVGLPFVQKMPLMVQRSLSFLPIEINPLARQDAEHSTEWRVKMWLAAPARPVDNDLFLLASSIVHPSSV